MSAPPETHSDRGLLYCAVCLPLGGLLLVILAAGHSRYPLPLRSPAFSGLDCFSASACACFSSIMDSNQRASVRWRPRHSAGLLQALQMLPYDWHSQSPCLRRLRISPRPAAYLPPSSRRFAASTSPALTKQPLTLSDERVQLRLSAGDRRLRNLKVVLQSFVRRCPVAL